MERGLRLSRHRARRGYEVINENQTAGNLVGVVLDGSYRIESLLGEGGMGAVYRATQLRLDKPVAVKVMARELAANQEALERFRREARVTSGLGHPNIVQVFDFSATPTGEPFFVLEFLEGEDLDHRLRRVGRLPISDVVHVVKQVASALAATHAKGIVHRDLKPGNIYLLDIAGTKDFVKVLDFGISKVRSASTKLTRTSSIMGTPNYMSPEQARGQIDDIDERTDQWALGCIAWECLAGRGPFVGENVPSILFQIVHEPPPPLLPSVAGLHPQVEEVLLRALAKNKTERFPTVGDFASALEAASTSAASVMQPTIPKLAPPSAPDTGTQDRANPSTTFTQTAGEMDDALDNLPSSSKRWAWVLAVVAVAGLLAFLLLRPGPPAKPVVPSLPSAAPPSAPVPAAPVATPPPVIEHEEKRVEAKNAATVVPAKPVPEPETKKSDSTHRSAKKRLPSKNSEEDQQLWH
jgi:serine/threonine protein kinase